MFDIGILMDIFKVICWVFKKMHKKWLRLLQQFLAHIIYVHSDNI